MPDETDAASSEPFPATPETGKPAEDPRQIEEQRLQSDFRDRAIAWLEAQGFNDIICSVCKHDEWSVTEPVVLMQSTLRKGPPGWPTLATASYPVFQLICTT